MPKNTDGVDEADVGSDIGGVEGDGTAEGGKGSDDVLIAWTMDLANGLRANSM
jgi:hypothetical protein